MRAVVFASAAEHVGTGHVMRSSVLVSELQDLGVATVFLGEGLKRALGPSSHLNPDCLVELSPEKEWGATRQVIAGYSPDFAVLDGYVYQSRVFRFLEEMRVPYLLFDDNLEIQAPRPFGIVNQNTANLESHYASLYPSAKLFLGPEYALIRRQFREAAESNDKHHSTVFVSFGGADVLGLTFPIVQALSSAGVVCQVAIGPHVSSRESVANKCMTLEGVQLVKETHYASALASAPLAVLAAGSSVWEAAFLRVPTVGIVVAPNQAALAAYAQSKGHLLEVFEPSTLLATRCADYVRFVLRAGVPLPGAPSDSEVGSKSLATEILAALAAYGS